MCQTTMFWLSGKTTNGIKLLGNPTKKTWLHVVLLQTDWSHLNKKPTYQQPTRQRRITATVPRNNFADVKNPKIVAKQIGITMAHVKDPVMIMLCESHKEESDS